MLSYEATAEINANRESIWRVLAAVDTWPAWLSTVSSVEPLDDQALRLGARYRIIQPKLRPARWIVTLLEPLYRFAWETRSPGLVIVGDHIIHESSPNSSTVVLRISFGGLLGRPVGRLTRNITEHYLTLEAAALKLKVESSDASGV